MKTIFLSMALLSLIVSCSPDKSDSTAEKAATLRAATAFDPNAGKPVSDKEAKAWIKTFKDKHGADELRGYYFSAESYNTVLATPGATGIRIVLGINDAGETVMILVPTDKDGNTVEGGTMYEFGQACPPYCEGGDGN